MPIDSPNHLLLGSEPGWTHWAEEVAAFLPQQGAGADAGFAALTRRQRELLELLARGCDNAQIAANLGLSEKTVRNHITGIFDRLEVDNPLAGDRAGARGRVRPRATLKGSGLAFCLAGQAKGKT